MRCIRTTADGASGGPPVGARVPTAREMQGGRVRDARKRELRTPSLHPARRTASHPIPPTFIPCIPSILAFSGLVRELFLKNRTRRWFSLRSVNFLLSS